MSARTSHERSATRRSKATTAGRARQCAPTPVTSVPTGGCAPHDARSSTADAPKRLTADDVMTAREVAGLLRSPASTVEDWARRSIVPSVKIGRRRLYIRHEIEAILIGYRAGEHQ